MKKLYLLGFSLLIFFGCKNSDVNPPNIETRPMHESINPEDFVRVTIEGNQYLIMERDRNNPHEGFGFMALDGSTLASTQDSVLAYQKVILENQIRIISRLEGSIESDLEFEIKEKLETLLKK